MAWSMLKPFSKMIGWAFLAGILLDTLSTAPFGVFTISMLLSAAAANFWFNRFATSAILLPIALMLPFSIGFDAISLLLQQILGRALVWNGIMLRLVFWAGLLNLGVMTVAYPLLQWAESFTRRDEIAI